MKIHIDVDCTPDEARTLFGLPDVKPMQQALLADIEGRMKKALAATEPKALLETWLPAGVQGFEQWQKFLWSRMTSFSKESVEEAEEGKAPKGRKS